MYNQGPVLHFCDAIPRPPQPSNKQLQKLSSHPAPQDVSKIREELEGMGDVFSRPPILFAPPPGHPAVACPTLAYGAQHSLKTSLPPSPHSSVLPPFSSGDDPWLRI
ncbi:hypothetical protein K443DRAFT_162882 [Laccaria amethystina LaAM-08-1]|uniref:Uncharacterized protein n=1 Tax=Laccaria amethystina LaAM-08-1 TaxID=1095629 RepID=A0A0C9XDI7_9AGAR|nr:hypothetical protein K443DRAFT_162882 [Laccaria amethystina LaAM-08-1]